MSDVQNLLHNLKKLARRQRLILDEISEETLNSGDNEHNNLVHDLDIAISDIYKFWQENKHLFPSQQDG